MRSFMRGIALAVLWAVPADAQRTVLPEQDRLLAVREDMQFTLGRLEGAAWEVFGGNVELGFDARGRLYALDGESMLVHAYDRSGRHRWTAGRRGGGPGEFSHPAHLAVLPQGGVVVADLVTGRLIRFDAEGRYEGSTANPERLLPVNIHPAGTDAVWFIPTASMARDEGLPIIRVPFDGEPTVVARSQVRGPRVERSETGLRRVLPPTFSPRLRTTAANNDLAFVENEYYTIHTVPSRRDSLLTRPTRPRPVTEEDRDAARRELRERSAQMRPGAAGGFRVLTETPRGLEERVRAMRFAEIMPVIQGLVGAPDGMLWVARTGRVAGAPGPVDVLGAGGRYIGTLAPRALPAALGPDGLAAWVDADELGVPVVRVTRIVLTPQPR